MRRAPTSTPCADLDAVRTLATGTDPEALLAHVQAVVAEAVNVDVDWSSLSLPDAGRAAAAAMAVWHPELDTAALAPLAWHFT